MAIYKYQGYNLAHPTKLESTTVVGNKKTQIYSQDFYEGSNVFIDDANKTYTIEFSDGTVKTGKITYYLRYGMAFGFQDSTGEKYFFSKTFDFTRYRYVLQTQTSPWSVSAGLKSIYDTGPGLSGVIISYWANSSTIPFGNYGEIVPSVCYLLGTLIATPDGDRNIEDLAVGDKVFTFRGKGTFIEDVVSVSRGVCNVDILTKEKDIAGYPVRFEKDSLGKGKPNKPLLVTAEHCMFLDGFFLPARTLVNGENIFYDESISNYVYYHFETKKHSIILANGAESETYLDTGNRISFALSERHSDRVTTPSKKLSWATDACAPLNTDLAFLKGVWSRFSPVTEDEFRNNIKKKKDPGIYLKIDEENIINPQIINDQEYFSVCLMHAERCFSAQIK